MIFVFFQIDFAAKSILCSFVKPQDRNTTIMPSKKSAIFYKSSQWRVRYKQTFRKNKQCHNKHNSKLDKKRDYLVRS